jgi:2-succinyl-5-enolpyruvyl-6-hydroxy-3-cyclohexene-1-carboxylate synthase
VIVATACDDPSAVLALGAALGWPVFAGPQSGCRTGLSICAFDALVRAPDAPTPEVVLRLGGLPASRATNEWLERIDADQIAVGERWVDPGRNAVEVVQCPPSAVCSQLMDLDPASSDWAEWWHVREEAAQKAITAAVEGEPLVARALTGSLPASTTLLVASSMPYRDVEWYGAPSQEVRVVANRGVNGIDGMVSTALGLATAGPVVALLGDLAFLHDAGGLVGASGDCTFVVIDNQGGGIFNFLPQATLPDFERYWGTPPGVDPAAVAAGYGVPVTVDSSLSALEAPHGVRVVVVRSDRSQNVAVHQALLSAIAAAIAVA